MALTRRTAAFAELAAGVEERLAQFGLALPSDLVDDVIRHRVNEVAQKMRVTDRTALGYADEASADAIARDIVRAARGLETAGGGAAGRSHLRVVEHLDFDNTPPLEVHVVRFSGRDSTRFAQMVDHIEAAHGRRVRITSLVAGDAAEACTALAAEADVVILAGPGYTRSSWRSARPWPGGIWYVGGRGPGDAGMSLDEFEAGVQVLGGLRARTFIVDAGGLTTTTLERLVAIAKASEAQLIVKAIETTFDAALAELVEVIRQLVEGDDLTTGLRYYRAFR